MAVIHPSFLCGYSASRRGLRYQIPGTSVSHGLDPYQINSVLEVSEPSGTESWNLYTSVNQHGSEESLPDKVGTIAVPTQRPQKCRSGQ